MLTMHVSGGAELGIAVHPLPAAYKHKAADGLGGFNPYGLHPDHVCMTASCRVRCHRYRR